MNAIHPSIELSEIVGRTHLQHWGQQITPCILLNDFGSIVAAEFKKLTVVEVEVLFSFCCLVNANGVRLISTLPVGAPFLLHCTDLAVVGFC